MSEAHAGGGGPRYLVGSPLRGCPVDKEGGVSLMIGGAVIVSLTPMRKSPSPGPVVRTVPHDEP